MAPVGPLPCGCGPRSPLPEAAVAFIRQYHFSSDFTWQSSDVPCLSPRTRHGRPLSLAESLEKPKELADRLVAKEHSCDGRCGEWERVLSGGHPKAKEIAGAFSFVGTPTPARRFSTFPLLT